MCDKCATELQLRRGLADLEAILAKAKVLPEWKRIILLEQRLTTKMRKVWKRRSEQATKAAVQRIKRSRGEVKETDEKAALRSIKSKFDGIGNELEPAVRVATEEIYRAGFNATNKKVQGKYRGTLRYDFLPVKKAPPAQPALAASFTAVDEEAIAALTEQHTFWIGEHYERNLSDSVSQIVRTAAIEEGRSPSEVGRVLERLLEQEFGYDPTDPFEGPYANIPVGWSSSAEEYFETVGAHVATVGRVGGQLSALAGVGATSYMIVNPLDERTCPRCEYMAGHGTSMPVTEAHDHFTSMARATPEEVRNTLHPFGNVGDYVAAAKPRADGSWTRNSAKRMISSGYGMPPFHSRCRCTVDIADDATFVEV